MVSIFIENAGEMLAIAPPENGMILVKAVDCNWFFDKIPLDDLTQTSRVLVSNTYWDET